MPTSPFGTRRNFDENDAGALTCRACGHTMRTTRHCQRVELGCPSCGATWSPDDYADEFTDDFEEQLANVPLDRI